MKINISPGNMQPPQRDLRPQPEPILSPKPALDLIGGREERQERMEDRGQRARDGKPSKLCDLGVPFGFAQGSPWREA